MKIKDFINKTNSIGKKIHKNNSYISFLAYLNLFLIIALNCLHLDY